MGRGGQSKKLSAVVKKILKTEDNVEFEWVIGKCKLNSQYND